MNDKQQQEVEREKGTVTRSHQGVDMGGAASKNQAGHHNARKH